MRVKTYNAYGGGTFFIGGSIRVYSDNHNGNKNININNFCPSNLDSCPKKMDPDTNNIITNTMGGGSSFLPTNLEPETTKKQ